MSSRFIITLACLVAITYPLATGLAFYLALVVEWPWYRWLPTHLGVFWAVPIAWCIWEDTFPSKRLRDQAEMRDRCDCVGG
jgi:hypothetical protein